MAGCWRSADERVCTVAASVLTADHACARMQCPTEAWRDWITYHMPCVHSFHEKMGLLDAYQSALSQLADPLELKHSPLDPSNDSELATSRRSVRRSRTA